jgi:inner membrane protein
MLLFGHIGITLGTALGIDKGLLQAPILKGSKVLTPIKRLAVMAAKTDYRLVLVGALLPDIIDKPVGDYFFAETFKYNGRIFCHTLLFVILLFLIGLYWYQRYANTGIIVLSLCSAFHLVLDQMWHTPQTLFWPADGFTFPGGGNLGFIEWLRSLFENALMQPSDYVPEIVALIILVPFVLQLSRGGALLRFLKTGSVSWILWHHREQQDQN